MDVERGLRTIPPREKRDHLLIARYTAQTRVADTVSKWSGYADPIKQAMADAGLIPQSPVIGESVDHHGFVKTKEDSPRDEKLYRGKNNGVARGSVVVQCTTPQHPTPVVVGSFWPRGKDEHGNLTVRPIYAIR